ncbi:DUF4328 domain-containing protein [Streptomyces sp. KL116D]|uniref:DUF4328 domain-containing protein n=1 Tax=Streptomyces sp. KL116D TaxID=3045152 RepID=UPI0035575A2F
MLCRKCGRNNALVEDGLCARCADEAFGSLTPAPGPDVVPDAPGPPAPPTPPFRMTGALPLSPNAFALAVTVLLAVVVVTDLFAIVVGVQEFRLLSDLLAGQDGGTADLTRLDESYALAGKLQQYVFLATGVVFIAWLFRVRHNGEVFAPDGHSKARPWVLFGFVVPIANLWFPRRIALDIWAASEPAGRWGRWRVDCWWFVWLAATATSWLLGTWYEEAETLTGIKDATGALVVSDAVDIVSAAFAILFVRSLTALQNQKVMAGAYRP